MKGRHGRPRARRAPVDVQPVPVTLKEALLLSETADFLEVIRSAGAADSAPAIDDCVDACRTVANRYAAKVGCDFNDLKELTS